MDPSGKLTTLLDSLVMGRLSSGRTKLEVAPESTNMVDAFPSALLMLLMVACCAGAVLLHTLLFSFICKWGPVICSVYVSVVWFYFTYYLLQL